MHASERISAHSTKGLAVETTPPFYCICATAILECLRPAHIVSFSPRSSHRHQSSPVPSLLPIFSSHFSASSSACGELRLSFLSSLVLVRSASRARLTCSPHTFSTVSHHPALPSFPAKSPASLLPSNLQFSIISTLCLASSSSLHNLIHLRPLLFLLSLRLSHCPRPSFIFLSWPLRFQFFRPFFNPLSFLPSIVRYQPLSIPLSSTPSHSLVLSSVYKPHCYQFYPEHETDLFCRFTTHTFKHF